MIMPRTDQLLFASLPLALCVAAHAQHTPDEALRALREGNQRFAEDRSVAQPVGPGVRRTLARGQSPIAIVVTCADSRVPPEHLFNTGLGELIVVRTAGHVVGTEAIATIEHAVERLNVPLCIVLGHEHCDVVAAAIEQINDSGHARRLSPAITKLLERIEPAIRKANNLDLGGKQLHDVCEEEHAQGTAMQCLRRSPLLRRFAAVGKFRMVAARYHVDGLVEWLPNRPMPQPENEHRKLLVGTIPAGLPPHVALRMLRAGHSRFLGDTRPRLDLTAKRRSALSEGQQPLAIIVTDSDSRVSPELIFDAGLGELYVVRTAGNTMTDETLASIEFAASQLGASLLVVMGHSRCESILAAANHPEKQQLTPHQRNLLRRLEPAVIAAREQHAPDVVAKATRDNVTRTVHEARSRSALLRQLETEGRFALLASYYDVATGDLSWLKVPSTFAKRPPTASADQKGAHGDAHDDHGSHAQSTHDDHAVAHGGGAHDDLPIIDFPSAPAGEMRAAHGHEETGAHNTGHEDAHGEHHGDTHEGSHGESHDDAHGDSHSAEHGDDHSEGHDHASSGHSAHGEEGHGSGHGHPHDGDYETDGHDHDSQNHNSTDTESMTDELLVHLKNPIVVVGITGIASLLAAALLVLRRKR